MTYIHSGTKPTTARKKKLGFMHALYSVFFGTESASTKPQTPTTAATSISMFVSSIRPLHIADGGSQSPPPPPRALSIATSKSSYASADFVDRVFDVDEEVENDAVEEEEEVVSGTAEISIGRVYQQIRLQALNSIGVVRGSN